MNPGEIIALSAVLVTIVSSVIVILMQNARKIATLETKVSLLETEQKRHEEELKSLRFEVREELKDMNAAISKLQVTLAGDMGYIKNAISKLNQ